MRTTLKIETPNKTIEVALKMVDGKQLVELELADLLSLFDGKSGKASVAPKVSSSPKSPKASKTTNVAPKVGAKRGRKPKPVEANKAPETVEDPIA